MTKPDMSRFEPSDMAAALGLLTRLPMRVTDPRRAAATWAYPLVGLIVGMIGAVTAWIALAFGVPTTITAGLVLVAMVVVTGAMHEDGLADCADGFWGGWDRARRLEIMKDSRIGAYGVLALVLSLVLRWAALVALLQADVIWMAIILPAMISRASMVTMMYALPHARDDGLSKGVGRPDRSTALIAAGIAAVAVALFWTGALIALALICGGTVLAAMAIARAKINGQTGDVLGATQQVVEIAALVVLAAVVAG